MRVDLTSGLTFMGYVWVFWLVYDCTGGGGKCTLGKWPTGEGFLKGQNIYTRVLIG